MKYVVHFKAGKRSWYYKRPLSGVESEFTTDRAQARDFGSQSVATLFARRLKMKHLQLRKLKVTALSVSTPRGVRIHARKNPSARNAKLGLADDLLERFSGSRGRTEMSVKQRQINYALAVGKLSGVMYEATRDGVTEQYFHKFKKSSRPLLIADHDGSQIGIVGGRYEFTERGIVDK